VYKKIEQISEELSKRTESLEEIQMAGLIEGYTNEPPDYVVVYRDTCFGHYVCLGVRAMFQNTHGKYKL
jgi:hypothetical protein